MKMVGITNSENIHIAIAPNIITRGLNIGSPSGPHLPMPLILNLPSLVSFLCVLIIIVLYNLQCLAHLGS